MLRLVALHEYLEGTGVVQPERLSSAAQDGKTEWAENTAGAGMLLYRHGYTGVIDVMAFRGDVEDLLAQVQVWMHDNIPGAERDDNTFDSWDGEELDSDHADISLRFTFLEEVHYIEAAPAYAGKDKVTLNGKDWQRGELAANRATTLDDPVIGQKA